MARSPQIVHVFVGTKSGNEVDEYLEEHYDDQDDDAPLSQFAADFFNGWYDHDFMEFLKVGKAGKAAAVIRKASYSESFLGDAVEYAEALDVKGIVCGIFVYDAPIRDGLVSGAVSSAAGFVYVGSYLYERPGDTQKSPERTDGHEGRAIRLLLTDTQIVSGSFAGELRRWNLQGDGRVLDGVAEVSVGGPTISIIAIPNGFAACGNRVVIWPDDGAAWELGADRGSQILDIALLGDNDTLVASSVKRTLIAWSLSSKAEIARVETGRYPAVRGLRSVGDVLYERDSEGVEHAWRWGDDDPFDSEDLGKGRWVQCGDRRLQRSGRDVVDEAEAVVLSHSDIINDLASDGQFFATACRDGSCRVARGDNGEVVAEFVTDTPADFEPQPWPMANPWGFESVAMLGDIVVVGDASGRVHRFRRASEIAK